jgi:NTE family protein
VLDAVTKLEFFSLVDGHPFARWLIRNLIRHNGFMKKLKTIALVVLISCLGLFFLNFILLLFVRNNPLLLGISIGIYVVTVILFIAMGITAWYIRKMAGKLKDSGYGINPGDKFYDWIKGQMIENGVVTVDDLERKASQPVPGIHLRVEHPQGVNGLGGDVTFIASELVTQNKIEFPKMKHLFRLEGQEGLQPAGFVRASMSIPLFFESYFIDDIPCTAQAIKSRWLETFNETDPPSVARFVDGGILSNFPISIFYNPQVVVPRLPTFGIDLDDSYVSDKEKHASEWSFQGYFGRIFNTIRNYYDKDFQLKNRVYSRGIGTVYLHEFNWLNFFLTDKEKLTMFEKGAEAATEFLLNFDWKAYKADRAFLQQVLEK